MNERIAAFKKYKTKAEFIYEFLREEIMNGTLKPGDRLLLYKIAEQMGTSEIPVREAIKRLEAERLVNVVPHAGATVAGISIEHIMEIYTIRASLEGLAAGMAAQILTHEDLARLEELLHQMDESFEAGNIKDFAAHDREFHLSLYCMAPNRRLYQLILELWNESQRARSVFNLRTDRLGSFLKDHRELMEALERKDFESAEQIVRQHRLSVAKALVEYHQATINGEKDKAEADGQAH